MKYFIIAGEASGDLHASRLIKEINTIDTNAIFLGMGGDLMQNEGCELIQHYKNMAFMGVINVLFNLKSIKKNIDLCHNKILEYKPDIIILVDYPGFNLRIAKWAKKHIPQTPIHYYIAPKIWAWKSYRIKSIKKYIDYMYTILPFETKYFKNKGYDVTYVGNPCVDAITEFKSNICEDDVIFRQKYNLDNRPIVALLAGSRKQEIKGCLKKMSNMSKYFPEYQFVVSGAPGIEQKFYYSIIKERLPIVFNDTYNLLEHSHSAIVNSGTATLETALIGTPQIVVYHVFGGIFASLLKKLILHIPFVSLVNLIGEKEVVRELIAHEFNNENLKRELNLLLSNDVIRNKINGEYCIIRSKLGKECTAQRCANEICKIQLNIHP